ncbi:hypothetical protein PV327_002063 [Microctonus hyperodae]|uniref:Uncharacterized protein n=1 Tax=Microctonus hyperodae TaxID=165561 RepID=A0AA39FES4_MICHY|nr:hypothetical protein PV327_002063 [Microctonus hyperodae]
MSVKIDNVDINTAFENLLFAEEKALKSGFEEGYSVGENQSLKGYHLGYHRAGILAAQLGCYSGVIDYCLNNKNDFSSKIVEQAKKLQCLIENYPKINDETVDILHLFDDIKLKFTKLCSIAKINSPYPETKKLDF